MQTVEQLTSVVTKDQALTTLLNNASSLGFAATSWQSGSWQRTMLEIFAYVYAAASVVTANIAKAGFVMYAAGDWLTLLARSHYDEERDGAVKTQGTVRLTCASSAGPYTIAASELVFADTVLGQTYRNTTGGTLTGGGTLDITVEAETAGSAGNVAPNTITVMKTPLAGVTCNNPIPSGDTSWITQDGSDQESDPALQTKCTSKWATLGIAPGLAYDYYAKKANSAVTRVYTDDRNPRGPGTIDLYIAGDSGDLSSTVVDAVSDYFDGTTDGIKRQGTGADLVVYSALRADITLSGTIYILAAYNTAATQAAITAAIVALFKALPVGGVRAPSSDDGVVPFGNLYTAIMTIPGVRNVAFTTPLADVPLEHNEVPVPVPNFSFVSV